LNYDSGAAECTMKTSLTCASLAEPAACPAFRFNSLPKIRALQCRPCGKDNARDKKEGQQAAIA